MDKEKEFLDIANTEAIHKKGNQWYFWDESQLEEFGPYSSREECEQHLYKYCDKILNMWGTAS
jgi:hypothetical protein